MQQLYVFKFFLYLDRFIGACIWRESNITISSHCGLELRKPNPSWWARLIGHHFLNRFWPNHCELAIQYDARCAVQTLQYLGY